LAGLPSLARHTFGDKILAQANRAALLDIETIEDAECFIPYATVAAFLREIERRTGENDLGLLFAPYLSLTRYGVWGNYILAARTLGGAIERAASTIGYHSRGDRIELSTDSRLACVSYRSAARGLDGYTHIATGTTRVLLTLMSSYLPRDWRPSKIELDIPRPASATAYEDAFGCPVTFGARSISIMFDTAALATVGGRVSRQPALTVEDLSRARASAASLHSLRGVVEAHIWAQVLSGTISEDSTAKALGLSVRSLQRALDQDGLTFRELTKVIRMTRAEELLVRTPTSITEISAMLGYSSPANFARAFHQRMGVAPREFRARQASASGADLSPPATREQLWAE
jgi:AraC-like DNA-binding protein